jgi:mRNA interferase HicA
VKRSTLLQHLRKHGCYLERAGRGHVLWCNPESGVIEAVPRQTEISNLLARKICSNLSVPEI